MFTLLGNPAFPDFKVSRLEKEIGAALGFDVSLEADFVYLLDAPENPDDETAVAVSELLDAIGRTPCTAEDGLFVAPRKGTVSPWSSKATDIFRSCGLGGKVKRVERAIRFAAKDSSGAVVPPRTLASAASCFHDRMTEGVYYDLSDIFAAG